MATLEALLARHFEKRGLKKTLKAFRKECAFEDSKDDLDLEALYNQYLTQNGNGTIAEANGAAKKKKKTKQAKAEDGTIAPKLSRKRKAEAQEAIEVNGTMKKQEVKKKEKGEEPEAGEASAGTTALENGIGKSTKEKKTGKKGKVDETPVVEEVQNGDVEEVPPPTATKETKKGKKKGKKEKSEEVPASGADPEAMQASTGDLQENEPGAAKQRKEKKKKNAADSQNGAAVQPSKIGDETEENGGKKKKSNEEKKSDELPANEEPGRGQKRGIEEVKAQGAVEEEEDAPKKKKAKRNEEDDQFQGSERNYFQRVKEDAVEFLDEKLKDNSYWAKNGADAGWGAKAEEVLGKVRGKNFRHEKTKKKKGSYRGGAIDTQSHSIKFDAEDD